MVFYCLINRFIAVELPTTLSGLQLLMASLWKVFQTVAALLMLMAVDST